MGFKKKEKVEETKAEPKAVVPVPPVPTGLTIPKEAIKAVEQMIIKKEKAGDDKMLKQPLTRDRSIILQALAKSVLESPMLGRLTVGKNQKDSFDTVTALFGHVVKMYDSAE